MKGHDTHGKFIWKFPNFNRKNKESWSVIELNLIFDGTKNGRSLELNFN